jgi:hypothetical protein
MGLQTLHPKCTVDEIMSAMKRDGGCIVRDVLSSATLKSLDSDVGPWIERSPLGPDDWGGRATKRTGALVARCPAARPVVMHPLILGAAQAFLGPYCERIQLNNTQLITLFPGQGAQPLHRDRLVWAGALGNYLPMPIEPQFNTIWALTDFTEENGATVVVPGSQGWDFKREPRPEEIAQAVMTRGSVLLYSGTVVHGGGMNRSSGTRIAMNITYNLSWLRQEENQYISCPPEIAKQLDPDLTDLIGYTMGNYALGFCSNPEKVTEVSDVVSPEFALGRYPRMYYQDPKEAEAAVTR